MVNQLLIAIDVFCTGGKLRVVRQQKFPFPAITNHCDLTAL